VVAGFWIFGLPFVFRDLLGSKRQMLRRYSNNKAFIIMGLGVGFKTEAEQTHAFMLPSGPSAIWKVLCRADPGLQC